MSKLKSMLFSSKEPTKISFFLFFCLLLTVILFRRLMRSYKTDEIKVFLRFCLLMEGSGSNKQKLRFWVRIHQAKNLQIPRIWIRLRNTGQKDLIKQEKIISHKKSEVLGIVLTKLLKKTAEKLSSLCCTRQSYSYSTPKSVNHSTIKKYIGGLFPESKF